jgi:hypothetical protein
MARAATHNGRPWYVRYAKSATGVAGLHFGQIGPFDTPFQPSNEAEELAMDADPLMYKHFATEAAATAWINSAAGKGEAEVGSGPAGAVQDVTENSFLGRLTEGSTWMRVGEFAVGAILLYIGVKSMFPAVAATATAPVKAVVKGAAIL